MKQEYCDIYNEDMELIGTELRSEVHKNGYWHKSFQCWFAYREGKYKYILFQKRHACKDTYPNLLDITAAGHLSAGETVEDASRELKEELGVSIDFNDLISIGIAREEKIEDNFIDREFGNVFLYLSHIPMEEFKLQADEVVGMYKVKLLDAVMLFNGERNFITAEGYAVNEEGSKCYSKLEVGIKDFVPHNLSYFNNIFKSTDEAL